MPSYPRAIHLTPHTHTNTHTHTHTHTHIRLSHSARDTHIYTRSCHISTHALCHVHAHTHTHTHRLAYICFQLSPLFNILLVESLSKLFLSECSCDKESYEFPALE